LRLVEADHDNIRAALIWLERSGDAAGLLRLAAGMGGFWFLRSHRREGRFWLERALDAAREEGVPTEARARALIGAGMLARSQGDYDRATALANEYLAIALEMGDPWREDEARWLLGYVASAQGAYAEATFQLERAVSLLDPATDLVDMADGLSMLAMAAYGAGDLERAASLQESVLETFRRVDDPHRAVVSLTYLGMIACDLGNYGESASRYAEALPTLQAIGWREFLAEWLAGMATLASSRGAAEHAAQFIGASEALRSHLGHAFTLPERSVFERGANTARTALGAEVFAAAATAGGEIPLEQAVTAASDYLQSVIDDPGPVRVPDVASAAGLTHREAEVVRLIAAGLSNAEIADSLFISVPTVKRHLTNILGKLELSSRSALNTWAHNHDVV
jgi:non-specific serine/threonine protein kinase